MGRDLVDLSLGVVPLEPYLYLAGGLLLVLVLHLWLLLRRK